MSYLEAVGAKMTGISRVVLVFRRNMGDSLIVLCREEFYYKDNVLITDESVERGKGKSACKQVITRLQLRGEFQLPKQPVLIPVTEGWLRWKKSILLRVFVADWSCDGEVWLTESGRLQPVRYYPHGHMIERKVNEQARSFAA